MGLFRQNAPSSSSTAEDPYHMDRNYPPNIASRSSSSSSRSVHSTHSNTTLKANSPPNNRITSTSSNATIFPYAVGKISDYHNLGLGPGAGTSHQQQDDDDTNMTDPFTMSPHLHHSHSHHQRHRIDSQGVPIPPARTTSLGHQSSSSTTSLPSVQVTTATPTKNRVRADTAATTSYAGDFDAQFDNVHGSGSLDIGVSDDLYNGQTFDGRQTLPSTSHASSSTDQLTSYTSIDEDSDPEAQAEKRALQMELKWKKDRERELGKARQRKKRAKDKAEKEAMLSGIPIPSTPTAVSRASSQRRTSRNPSSTSLAPLIVPTISSVSPGLAPLSATSMYSSLPTSTSFPSLSPNGSIYTIPSQQTSSASSPTTFFSPMTPATSTTMGSGSGQTSASASTPAFEGYPWASTQSRASKSAVDVRASASASASAQTRRNQKSKARPPSSYSQSQANIVLAPASTRGSVQPHSAKRRRSEPEPEPMKTKDVGLGVMGIPEHSQGPIEFLAPNNEIKMATPTRDRPGIRRTASDSATASLDFFTQPHSTRQASRSPTPPLLESLKTEYTALDEEMPSTASPLPVDQAGLLATVALRALIESPVDAVKRALTDLKLSHDSLRGLQPELAAFFGRFHLEKEMGSVTLEDRPNTSYSTRISMPEHGHMSNATTPLHDSIPLSATSTCPSSPTMSRFEMPLSMTSSMSALPPTSSHGVPAGQASRASTSKATPKNTTKTGNRARSLSSASMRARGLKLSSTVGANTNVNVPLKSPIMSLYQETLVSPMNSTTYQFPNTPPIHHAMPDSDGASPMNSSVQTPTTGHGSFPHHEIMAIGAGTMSLHQREGMGGMGQDEGHHRSATDPMGSKVYTTRQGSSWDMAGTFKGGDDGHDRGFHRSAHSQSMSQVPSRQHGLSSPLDMPKYNGSSAFNRNSSNLDQHPATFPAPPPHLPPTLAFAPNQPLQLQQQQQQVPSQYPPHGSNTSSPINSFQSVYATPSSQRHRHHPTTSISAPYTPTPMSQNTYALGHSRAPLGQISYQPSVTPIAEQGTPTRPSPSQRHSHSASMSLAPPHQHEPGYGVEGVHTGAARQGEMEQMMLSPQPPLPPLGDNGWVTFGHSTDVGPGSAPGPFEMDPFISSNQQGL